MLNKQTQDQLDRIEREQVEIKALLARLLESGTDAASLPVLQESKMNDLARDFSKRGSAAFADHNRKRRKQLRQ